MRAGSSLAARRGRLATRAAAQALFVYLAPTLKEKMPEGTYLASEGGPSTGPVILWSNGGPGASSLFGLLVELGPLLLNDQSLAGDAYEQTGVPTLFYNPSAWTRRGSVRLVASPAPPLSQCLGDIRRARRHRGD